MFWLLLTSLLFIVLVAAMLIGWSRGLLPPEVKLVSIRPERLQMQQQTLRVGLRIKNPNRIPLPVRSMSYKLWLDEQEIASGSGRLQRWVPGQSAQTIEVLVTGDSRRLAKRLPRLALKPQPWPYRIAGRLSPLAPIQIGYDHRGQIDARGIIKLAAALR
jgi:LEA14-like dessication related protein